MPFFKGTKSIIFYFLPQADIYKLYLVRRVARLGHALWLRIHSQLVHWPEPQVRHVKKDTGSDPPSSRLNDKKCTLILGTDFDVSRRYKHQNSFMAEKAQLCPAKVCVMKVFILRKTRSHITKVRRSPSTPWPGSWTMKGLAGGLTSPRPSPPEPGYLLVDPATPRLLVS